MLNSLAQTATETPCEERTRSWSGRLVVNAEIGKVVSAPNFLKLIFIVGFIYNQLSNSFFTFP